MKTKVLCAKWGTCRAKKKCPLPNSVFEKYDVYVKGKCANKTVKVVK